MSRIYYIASYFDPDYAHEDDMPPDEMFEDISFFKSLPAAAGYLHAKWEGLRIDYHEILKETPDFVKYTHGDKIVWGPGQTLRIFVGDFIA